MRTRYFLTLKYMGNYLDLNTAITLTFCPFKKKNS